MLRLGLLVLIVATANVLTALSTLFVAIQLLRWDMGEHDDRYQRSSASLYGKPKP